MFKAILIMYVLNPGTTKLFTFDEMPSMAACNKAMEIAKSLEVWTKGGEKVSNNYSMECVPTTVPNNAALLNAIKSRFTSNENHPLVVPRPSATPLRPIPTSEFGWKSSGKDSY